MAMTTENGIHMKYSGAVREQRLNAGKPVEAPPEPAPAPDMSDLTASRVENLKLVYGMMLCIGTARIKDIQDRTGKSYNWAADALVELQARGLLSARQVGAGQKSPYEYIVVGDATLPAGWEVEALRKMAEEYVPPERKEKKDDGELPLLALLRKNAEVDQECAMAKALKVTRLIDANAVWQYRTLYDLIRQMPDRGGPEGRGLTGEMQDILKELRRFLEFRMKNVKTECPFCRGTVINENGATCTKCKRQINMGSFENSLAAMRTLAEMEAKR